MDHIQREPWLMTAFIERYEETLLDEANILTHNAPYATKIVQDTFKKMYVNPRGYETHKDRSCVAWSKALLQESLAKYNTLS